MNDAIFGSEEQQAKILDQILAIGQTIQQHITENPQKVYKLIVKVACEMTGADCAVIYPYHPSFGEFYDVDNIAAHGLRHELQLEERPKKGLAALVHREGEVIREDIEREDPEMLKESLFIATEKIKAFMGLSLQVNDNVLGILYVDYRKPHHFSKEEKKVIRLLGQQAAIAIFNSWTSRLASIRAQVVAKLKTVGQALVAIEDVSKTLDSVLDEIAHSAQEGLDADIVDLYQYIQARNEFVLPPTLVGERWHPHVPKTRIYDDDVVMKAVKIGEPQYFYNAQATPMLTSDFEVPRDDAPDQRFVMREGVISSTIIPLKTAGETVGVMFVNYRTPQVFGAEQKDVIESFAAQAAVAIYNARLFQLEQEQRQQSDTLREVARIVSATLEREEVIGLVLDQLRRVTEYRSASVQLIQGDRRILVGGRGFSIKDSPRELLRNVSEDPLVSRIVQSRRPLVLSDIKDEPLWDHMPQTARTNSWIGAPLIVRGEVIGLLTLDHEQAGYYTQESGEIVAAFANQVAVAIHNTNLFQQVSDQTQALAELNELASQLVSIEESPRDTRNLLEQVTRSAQQVLRADMIELYEYAQEQDDYRLPQIAVGERKGPSVPKDKIYKDDAVFNLIHRDKPLYVENTQADATLSGPYTVERKDQPTERFVIREGIQSSAAIPLRTGAETVGLMFANYRTPQAFTPEQREIIESFAYQAAIAIHNSRLFSESLRHRNELQVVDEIGKLLMATLDSREVPRLLLQQIIHRFGVEGASLWQVDQNNKSVKCLFALDRTGRESLISDTIQDMTFRFGEGIVGTVAESGEPMVVNQVQEEPRWDKRVDEVTGFKTRSILSVPLVHKQETIGVVQVLNRLDKTPFTAEDRNFLTSIVSPAAIALENAQLYQAERARRQELEAVQRASLSLTASLDLSQVLDSIVRAAFDLVSALDAHIFLYADGRLTFGSAMGVDGPWDKPFSEPRSDGLTYTVARQGEAIVVPDMRTHPLFTNAPADWKGAIVGLPLKIGQNVVGVMNTARSKPGDFSESELRALRLLADQAAIAIENARLYQALERRVEALGALNKVSQTLTAGIRLKEDQILELIYEQAHQLTDTQDMYIALYDDATEMIRFGLALERGQRVEIAPRKADMAHRGKTEEIILNKQPILHSTKNESEDWYELPGRQEFLGRVPPSWMGVPMIVGEKVLGMIAVYDWKSEYAYDEQDSQVLSSMANQAAIALDNASLYYEINQALERRVEALAALNEVGQTLTAGIRLREDEILELIYKQARKLTSTLDMYIALYDDATEMIRFPLALEKGERVDYPTRQADMEKRGKTEEIILTREPILHRTRQEAQDWYEAPGHQEFVGLVLPSWVGVPMIIGEKVLGVIAIYDVEREHAYDEQDLQVLSAMSSQATIALDNASLYYEVNQALERRVESLAALNEVGQTLTAGLRLEQDAILQLIYAQARRLTNTENIYIAPYDESTDTLSFRLVMEKGQRVDVTQHESFAARKIDKANLGKTEAVILTREPILHKTKAEEIEWYSQPSHRRYVGQVSASHLAVPMMIGERVLGVIAIYDWEREHAYDEPDLQILSSMASQAAIALDNANLYYDVNKKLERRIRQIQTVQQITNAIKTYEELPDLLQSILDVSLPPLNAQAGTVQLLDPTTNELVMRAAVGPIERSQYERIPLDQGITGQAAREGHAIYVPDASQDERFLDYLGQMRSEFAIPLQVNKNVIGVFNIEDPRPDAFDEATRELATLIADQAAIVIQNAQQYAAAREELIANRQLAALGTATAAIQHRINNTLHIIRPNIGLLRKRVDTSDKVIQDILDIIERNARYTSDYINRIQEPLKETEVQLFDVNASLRDALNQVSQQYEDQARWGKVNVIHRPDDSLPLIEASLGQITEIFRNLIENGFKAMIPGGGTLTAISRRVDHWLEVEIQDTGPGIPSNIRDKLFIKPVPSRTPGEGSGLGLWLTNLLLQKYGGEIIIANTGPDGTTMLVRLPVSRS
jgi:GAF domain-containing protein